MLCIIKIIKERRAYLCMLAMIQEDIEERELLFDGVCCDVEVFHGVYLKPPGPE